VKKHSLAFLSLSILFVFFFSCKKINESTDLGGGLIPGVDNINTFEISLATITDNHFLQDSPVVRPSDLVVAGHIDDPVFGTTHANFQFGVLPNIFRHNPFYKDSVQVIDSVVLSLAYAGGWGDTTNGIQTLRVFEIQPTATQFRRDSLFRYDDPGSEFPTTGAELGSKTFQVSKLKDPIIIREPDSTQVTNVVRIPLDNSIGQRLSVLDTSSTSTGGFGSDSTFRTILRGFSIKADNSGNVLTYFDLTNTDKSKLTVYYRVIHWDGSVDTLAYDFPHVVFRAFNMAEAKTNYIQRNRAGSEWDVALNNGTTSDSLIYLQTSPSGSYVSVVVPGLENLSNRVIHLAEIIGSVPIQYHNTTLTPPSRLFMDRKRDTNFFLFERDIPVNFDGSLVLDNFGGVLRTNTYKMNITRYVQNIITRGEVNDTLRLYAPFRSTLTLSDPGTKLPETQFADRIGRGRVVLAGGNYSDTALALRLRIIYSNL